MIDLSFPRGAFRLIENDIELDADGGRIVITADNGPQSKTSSNPRGDELDRGLEIIQATLMINYRQDDPMREWPATREDRARRRFTIRVIEEPPGIAVAISRRP